MRKVLQVFLRVLSVLITFCLAIGSAFSQSRIDSLERVLQQMDHKDEVYVDVMNDLSFEYMLRDPDLSNEWVSRSLFLADSLQYPKGQFRALVNQGSAFFSSGLFDAALLAYFGALTVPVDDPEGQMIISNNIGEVFKKKGQLDSAFLYYRRAYAIAETLPIKFPSVLASNIAETHFLMENYDSAHFYFERSTEYAILDQNERGIAFGRFGLGEIALKNGQLDQAMREHMVALRLREKIRDNRGLITSYHKIGFIHQLLDNMDSATYFFDQAEELANEITAFDLLMETYRLKAELFQNAGEYELAIAYLKRFQSLKDSLDAGEFSTNINSIKAAITADREYTLLRQRQLQDARALKTQTILLASLAIVLVVLIVLLIKYYQSLKLTRSNHDHLDELNKEILQKNKEIQRVNKLLDNQLKLTSKVLSDSQALSRFGSWQYDAQAKELTFTDETYRQLGMEPSKNKASLKLLQSLLGDEYKRIQLAFRMTRRTHEAQAVDVELTNPTRFIHIRMVPEFDGSDLLRVNGSNHDITETVLTEKRELSIIQSLLHVSRKVNLEHQNFLQLVDEVVRNAAETLQVERVSFWEYHVDRGRSFITCFSMYDIQTGEYNRGLVIQEEEAPSYFKALREHRTIATNHAMTDSRTREFVEDYLIPNDIHSMMDAPVLVQGQLHGLLCFEKTRENMKWSYSDQRYGATLADLVSKAYSAQQNRLLEDEKEKLITRLLKQNESLRDFTNVISHNLRDPVAQILGLASLNQDRLTPDVRAEILPRIYQSAQNLDQVIKDLNLILKSQESQNEGTALVSLRDALEIALQSLSYELTKTRPLLDIRLNADTLAIPRAYLYNLFYNLISNALKYRQKDRRLELRIESFQNDQKLTIIVGDNGQGMNMQMFENKIFRMYQRYHHETEGRGIGLYLLKNQLETLGGVITVESEPGVGTTFTVVLPLSGDNKV